MVDNYELGKNRLANLVKRIKRDNFLYSEQCTILNSYLNEGIIKMEESINKPWNKPLYYLPHHVVERLFYKNKNSF